MNIEVKVVLVRHAETEENLKVENFCEALKRLRLLHLPTQRQIKDIYELITCKINFDSKLSQRGQRQVRALKEDLSSKEFWSNFDFDRCVYSPLQRTKSTCLGIIPEEKKDRCTTLECLKELLPFEELFPLRAEKRMRELENWIITSNVRKLVIVGHSQYFRRLLKMKELMGNCDVWQAIMSFDGNKVQWKEATLLFKCELSSPHPVNEILSWRFITGRLTITDDCTSHGTDSQPGDANSNDRVQEDDEENDKLCRICQARQSELPNLPMVRPCRCSGSLRYVHIQCLNQWRATSVDAFQRCQICNYEYRIDRSSWSKLAMHPTLILSAAVLIVLLAAFVTGLLLEYQILLPVHYLSTDSVLDLLGLDINFTNLPICKETRLNRNYTIRNFFDTRKGFMKMISIARIKNFINSSVMTLPVRLLACNSIIEKLSKIFLAGVITVGLLLQVIQYINFIRQWGDERREMVQAVGVTFIWFNAGDLRNTLRIWVVLGIYNGVKNLNDKLVGQVRKMSQDLLGERIIEVED